MASEQTPRPTEQMEPLTDAELVAAHNTAYCLRDDNAFRRLVLRALAELRALRALLAPTRKKKARCQKIAENPRDR